MKKPCAVFISFIFIITFFSCKSLKEVDVTGVASQIPTQSVTTALAGTIDFKSGEVLCANTEESMIDNDYYVAKVLTPATPATKNQAQVLFLDGKEQWTKFVIPSHKAANAEMVLGKYVLFNSSSGHEDMSEDAYRKHNWSLGRITSTDELFKNLVEINGRKYYVKWLRIPEAIVK